MSRYFLEVAYKGTNYSGFQSQQNANTIQAEIEKALHVLFGLPTPISGEGQGMSTDLSAGVLTKAEASSDAIGSGRRLTAKTGLRLTGSSRTDTGVHALQNFFHFDTNAPLSRKLSGWRGVRGEAEFAYKMNAILPEDIVVKKLIPVAEDAHCRFDAVSREYKYYIYSHKDPFLMDRAFYFPYKLDIEILHQAALILKGYEDFTSFSKRNTQVKSFKCEIGESEWYQENDCLVYRVKANRFLRGMVRALTATMLKIGRKKMTLDQFRDIIEAKDCTKASFAVPSQGLFLVSVEYPPSLLGE